MNSIHTFTVEGIDGKAIRFADYKGKKILVVNVASACGFTPQYAQLQELSMEFQDHLVVVGIPCNDFGGQEPGDNEQIQAFCSVRFGVTFPLSTKLTIKGPNKHPLYSWLTSKAENGVLDADVRWNFTKFLLDENGCLLQAFPSSVSPLDEDILNLVTP